MSVNPEPPKDAREDYPTRSDLASAFITITKSVTFRNGVIWTDHDQIVELLEQHDRALRAKVVEECKSVIGRIYDGNTWIAGKTCNAIISALDSIKEAP